MKATSLRLSKLHGAGNDFLVTVVAAGRGLDAGIAVRLCDRHRGIGADGLITLLPGRDGADCAMELRNADGGLAEMSGNGIACLSWVAAREGLGDGKRLVVDTGGGRREVELDVNRATGEVVGATVDMGPVTFDPAEIPLDAASALDLEVTFHGVTYHGDAAGMGNPHLVLLVDDPETTRVTQHGPHLETDARFPHRTNVEFVAVAGDDELTMRVWERGVGETLSCGTGVCASAAVAHRRRLVGEHVTVRVPGGTHEVELGETIRLRGPVTHVFDTEVTLA
ncbi:MAG TPA: diaminopimelate epimerase [Acidimicrobiia bacterium]|nr:diaminopimelate epimerase [Acidimicrobiia bacterium]